MYAMRCRCWCGLLPNTLTVPRVGVMSPATIRNRVDLPAPFSPRMTVQVPDSIAVVILRRAAKVP